mgnify:CR=1 FL=1
MLSVESLDRKTSGDNVSKVYENYNEDDDVDDDDENELLVVGRDSRCRRNTRSRLSHLLICTYCDEASRPWADSAPTSPASTNKDDDDNWTTRRQQNDDQNEYYG